MNAKKVKKIKTSHRFFFSWARRLCVIPVRPTKSHQVPVEAA